MSTTGSIDFLYWIIRFVYPIRLSSTALAASLPSRMAHTTRDCPLCISPAVKTFFTEVAYCPCAVFTLVRSLTSTLKASVTYFWLPRKPAAISAISAGRVFSEPAISLIFMRPVSGSFSQESFTIFTAFRFPFLSFTNSFTVDS